MTRRRRRPAPLTAEQLAELRRYSTCHQLDQALGLDTAPTWQERLSIAWLRAGEGEEHYSAVLHRLRHTHGPTWLAKFTLEAEGVR